MRALLVVAVVTCLGARAFGEDCVQCHEKATPGIVTDWQLSEHSKRKVGCIECHGADHESAADTAQAKIPTHETCGLCHAARVQQFANGKHGKAWIAMKSATVMPSVHWQPMSRAGEGMKDCAGCHKIGLKSEAEVKELKQQGTGFGAASCDSCHTRHTFSVAEAREPQACQTCHMGFDHPQYEMYSSSKHGVRHALKQMGVLPRTASAPTCQTCHMQEGNHEVRTAWGFLGLRLPLPEDPQWAADRLTILQALGVLDARRNPTPRFDVLRAADMIRLTDRSWQQERDKMLDTCSQCHARTFANSQLAKGDQVIEAADRLMAEAIQTVADLIGEGLLRRPAPEADPFPDLLAFHDEPTTIERKLFVMFLEHRMRAFQGTFHANPDYALWYGWSSMVQDLSEIKSMAAQLRANADR